VALDPALIAIDRSGAEILRDGDLLKRYSHDESEVEAVMPEAVVRVATAEQVAATLRACSAHGVHVTPRSGGTGRVGGAVPVPGGIVLSTEKMNDVREIVAADLKVVTQPGVVLSDLHAAVEAEGLLYPPDPNSLDSCQLGGNLACNAGGPRAFKYGVTRAWTLGLEVVTASGDILRVGKPTAKGVTGYDLAGLVVGSEGTLAVVTEATMRLVPKPEAVGTLLVFLPDLATVGAAITTALGRGIVPRCLELLDGLALEIVRPRAGLAVPEGSGAMLLVEVDGEAERLDLHVERCGNAMMDAGALEVLVARHGGERERLWAARREMSYAMRQEAKNKLSEDVVVPRTRIADLLGRCAQLADRHRIRMPSYGHAGDGNLHVNFLWDEPDERPRVDAAIRELFEAVVEMGGTLSGEHGIGVLKAPYLSIEQPPALIALQERIKQVFDPKGILNPGKIFPAGAKRFHGAC